MLYYVNTQNYLRDIFFVFFKINSLRVDIYDIVQ